MEEQPPATVTVATGALGAVLEKLTTLLGNEQHRSRLGAGTRSDIESIRSMLSSLHALLLRIWEREDPGAECNEWMTDARALSYDMEDDIDDYMLGLQHGDVNIGDKELNKLLRHLKMRVEAISRRCHEEWKAVVADEAISTSNKRSKPSPADPRAGFLHKDASELVGMYEPLAELLELLLSGDHEMVCIHGFAGTGKTTLADVVYQEIGNKFECRAFVSLSKSPDMLAVLGAILTQVTEGVQSVKRTCAEATPEENLIHDISMFLSRKRYMVLVDDIWLWQSWEIIRRALPKGNGLCRIIATTRVRAIAEKCWEEGATTYRHSGIGARAAARLSWMKILQHNNENPTMRDYISIADMIADMCGGMTLAVRCLSSAAVASINDTWLGAEHKKLWHLLLDGLLCNNPKLRPMVESLRLGYDDLPVHVKSCLLYCSIFPAYYKIERNGLVRKWIAQGFFPKGPEQEKETAAEACLDELVSRGLLQQKLDYCTVHPMMRAFLLWKSKQANFATCFDVLPYEIPPSYASAPMLFVGLNRGDDTISSAKDGSRARCLVVTASSTFGWYLFNSQDWKRLRVLEALFQGFHISIKDSDLEAICSQMTRLRYLGLKGTRIRALPQQIGTLQNLETLDMSDTAVRVVHKEIGKLHHIELPRDIGKLQHLRTLNVSNTSVREIPRDIRKLQHLKTLDVSNSEVQELPWLSSSSVSVLVGDKAAVKLSDGVLAVMQAWNSHTISPSVLNPGKDLSIMLYDYLRQPLPVAGLKVRSGHMMGVPEWLKQHLANDSYLDIRLCKLNQDDLNFLRNQMPNMKLLTLRLEVLPRTPIVVAGEGFSMLESFCLDCRLPMVTFRQGALPKLEHLEFKFYTSRALTSEVTVGIRNLKSLKRVVFQSSPRYKSDAPGISTVINKLREEAKEHPNKITISINGKQEEVIQEKKKATMTFASSDKISEGNIVTSNGGTGGGSGASMIQTRPPIPYNTGTDDDEKRGNIIPVKSYYPFGVTE